MKTGIILILAVISIAFGFMIVKSLQDFNNMLQQYFLEIKKTFLIPKVFYPSILSHSSTLSKKKLLKIKPFLTENEFKHLDKELNINDKRLGKLQALLLLFLIICTVVLSFFD